MHSRHCPLRTDERCEVLEALQEVYNPFLVGHGGQPSNVLRELKGTRIVVVMMVVVVVVFIVNRGPSLLCMSGYCPDAER